MNILEKEIEDVIWQSLSRDRSLLVERGLSIHDDFSYIRQLDLGTYGIADIVGFKITPKYQGSRCASVHLIELKKEEVNRETFFQALRYCKAIYRILAQWLNCPVYFSIDLIGKGVDTKSDFIYLPDLFYEINLYSYKIDLQKGITFSRHNGYHHSNEQFPCFEQYSELIKQNIKAQIMSADEHPF